MGRGRSPTKKVEKRAASYSSSEVTVNTNVSSSSSSSRSSSSSSSSGRSYSSYSSSYSSYTGSSYSSYSSYSSRGDRRDQRRKRSRSRDSDRRGESRKDAGVLNSANLSKVGTAGGGVKGVSSNKQPLTEAQEVALYLSQAKARVAAWRPDPEVAGGNGVISTDPLGLRPASGPSSPQRAPAHGIGVTSVEGLKEEFGRFIAARFKVQVSKRGVILMSSLLSELCHTTSHVEAVMAVLQQRLNASHTSWFSASVGGTGGKEEAEKLRQDWLLVDAAVKHLKKMSNQAVSEAVLLAKRVGKNPEAAEDKKQVADLKARYKNFDAVGTSLPSMLDQYLPWDGEEASAVEMKKEFRNIFRTWKAVFPKGPVYELALKACE